MGIKHALISKIVPLKGDRFELQNRMWQGCPTIASTRGGFLYAGWYSGGTIEPSLLNYNIVARSKDGGINWTELFAIDGHADARIQSLDIQMFTDPSGRLWICWVQRDYKVNQDQPGHLNEWAVICDDPDAEEPVFSEPVFIGEGFMRCKPTFLKDKRWLIPAYDWLSDHFAYLESSDNGKTFQEKHAGKKLSLSFDENMFLERNDGSLYMLARTEGTALAECESTDGGATWTDGRYSSIPNRSTRFFIQRLPSGRVLLVNNHDIRGRLNMTALLSEDDARSWKYSLLLDPRVTSYPDVAIGNSGEIYVVYDRGRRNFKEILISRITEEDIIAGYLVSHDSYQNNIVSKGPSSPALGKWYKEAMEDYDIKFRKSIGIN